MHSRYVGLLALTILVFSLAAPAAAQNRLAVEIGPLIPAGDLADGYDTSLWFGARFELQDVNPLGQLATLSVYGRAGYAVLNTDADFEELLDSQGLDTGASYFDIGVGARAYSVASPFFVSASASYGRFEASGADGRNAFTPAIGLGFSLGFAAAVIDIEGRAHLAMVEEIDNQQFFTVTGSVGFPF